MRPLDKKFVTEPDSKPSYAWVEAALRANDPNAFLMGLSDIEFAVLLAELEAKRLPAVAPRAPGRQRRNGRLKENPNERLI